MATTSNNKILQVLKLWSVSLEWFIISEELNFFSYNNKTTVHVDQWPTTVTSPALVDEKLDWKLMNILSISTSRFNFFFLLLFQQRSLLFFFLLQTWIFGHTIYQPRLSCNRFDYTLKGPDRVVLLKQNHWK